MGATTANGCAVHDFKARTIPGSPVEGVNAMPLALTTDRAHDKLDAVAARGMDDWVRLKVAQQRDRLQATSAYKNANNTTR